MTALGSGKIWILVPDWSRLKSSESKAGDVTRKIGSLYFKTLTFDQKRIGRSILWFKTPIT